MTLRQLGRDNPMGALVLYRRALGSPGASAATRSIGRVNIAQLLTAHVGGYEEAVALLSSGGSESDLDLEPMPWARHCLLQLDMVAHRQVAAWQGFEDREARALSSLREWLVQARSPIISPWELLLSSASASLVAWYAPLVASPLYSFQSST
jgi:hypothetical protein